MAAKYRVIKIKGAEPEAFIVVGIDFGESAIKSTSATMSEAEMRAYLQQAGASPSQIGDWIEQARKYPG